jgi:hypothetical protein
MLASTKTGTVVKLVSGGEGPSAQVGTSFEPRESRAPGCFVGFVLDNEPGSPAHHRFTLPIAIAG